ncbi:MULTISPECIES: hypothetical protein [Arthrobacter]|uniref:EcsC protein family protein n=2 Tax=Arthrobacter TaxID=1663 RepID=A0ABU9KI93_9MICC|nr:hypothetical protein [Arthrobacter sp. YJM1]MDP5226369.1 hypothetical protein [Arthrobacter sp. YJM1]
MAKRKNPALGIAQDAAQNAMFDDAGKPRSGVHSVLLKAVDVQRPLVVGHLSRLRRKHPNANLAELVVRLERQYLATVTATGAGAGVTAVIPGVGTGTALAVSGVATAAFLEATALFASSVAELHGIRVTDPEKARTMVMAIMLGEEGTALLSAFTGQTFGKGRGAAQVWGTVLRRKTALSGFEPLQGAIQKAFLRSLLKKQGGAFVSRLLPFGVGAVMGGGGNLLMGRAVIANTREAFSALPLVAPFS